MVGFFKISITKPIKQLSEIYDKLIFYHNTKL